MTLNDLLLRLDNEGVRLVLVGGEIRARAAAGTITPDLLAALKAHKAELKDPLHRERVWQQLSALVEHRGVLVHPRYIRELDERGLL